MAIFRGVTKDIELIIIDDTKICKTVLTSKKESEWSDSSAADDIMEPKLRNIFEMMNGKKFGNPKIPLFMMKAA